MSTTSKKRALITGVTGQDGFYLSRLLLDKGYGVYGLLREGETAPFEEIKMIWGEMNNPEDLKRAVRETRPNEVYNLAGISDLGTAIANPDETMRVNYEAVGVLVNTALSLDPVTRIAQASSRETFNPTNIYGVAKKKADEEFIQAPRAKGAFTCSAFFYNHESPLRTERFVTRKITSTLTKIRQGKAEVLELGNLSAVRDWGFAGDFMKAMWMMLQQDEPNDYVIATGEPHTVRDFVTEAAENLDIKLFWEGEGMNEVGRDENGRVIVRVNPEFYRPLDKFDTIGDISRAKQELGWEPRTSFEELVRMMVLADLEQIKNI